MSNFIMSQNPADIKKTNKPKPDLERKTSLNTHEEEIFYEAFDEILSNIQNNPQFKDIPEISEWVKKVLLYNLPHGKQIRGRCVVSSMRVLFNPNKLSNHDIKLASVLGWIIEMFHACFLVAEDIMKKSETRRRQSCWYLTQASAVNDAFILLSFVYQTLDSYFKHQSYYKNLVRLFRDAFLRTSLGQCADIRKSVEICSNFSMKVYSQIVKYRSSYYTFILPIKAAFIMAGDLDETRFTTKAEDILLEIGELFQIQDDYLNCYGSAKLFGNIGSQDIQENNYSWLVVRAIEIANEQQEDTIRDNYGKGKETTMENIQAVKNVYAELQMTMEFLICETTSYIRIFSKIQDLSKDFPTEILTTFLNLIYGRKY